VKVKTINLYEKEQQMNLLPITVRFGYDGFPVETTYWDTDICKNGLFYLINNMNKYFLFIPENKDDVLREMDTGKSIVITRGNYNGKSDCFDIMFNDNTDNPYAILLEDEYFTRNSPLKEGWNGTFYIYSGSLEEYKSFFANVYYRVTENIPCLQPVTEQPDNLHDLTPLNHEETIISLKAGEYLVNGKDSFGIAHYHWYENHILKSDSYYDLSGEGEIIQEDKLPQLYRMGDGTFGNLTDHARSKIKPLLETKNYPLLLKKFNLEKLTEQIVSICSKTGRKIINVNFEVILDQLEKSLK
jgi:hypothetical protein